MQVERKRLHQLDKCPAHVFARMDEMLQADTKRRCILREEYQNAMSQAREKYALQKKVSQCKSAFKELGADIKRIEAVVAETKLLIRLLSFHFTVPNIPL